GAGGYRFALAGRLDGLARGSDQPGEYHDSAAGHRDRCDQWDSHPESVCRRTNAQYPGAKHRQGGARLRVNVHGWFREFDSRPASGHSQPGVRDDCRPGDVHGRGTDVPAGAVELADALAGNDRTTQCRQCTVDTGSGGTEVKTPDVLIIEKCHWLSILMF